MNIGVTGCFLSGKTTLSRLLAEKLGFRLFSCDDFVQKLYRKKAVRKKVLDIFGKGCYKGHVLQKELLSQLVFQSPKLLRKLESIIHPLVEAEIIRQSQTTNHSQCTVFEIPLLYEKGLNRLMDVCILVWSDKKNCLWRAKLRGFTKKDYEMRTQFQWNASRKKRLRLCKRWNPWIIANQGDLKMLELKSSILAESLRTK